MAAEILGAMGRAALNIIAGSDRKWVRWAFDHDAEDGSVWQVERALVQEHASKPYRVHLALATNDVTVDPSKLMGVNAVLTVNRLGDVQQVCGIVTDVAVAVSRLEGESLRISLTMAPALSLLGLKTDTRVFQDLTVPEIVKEVLSEDLEAYGRELKVDALTRTDYPKREYAVQHRESDLAFVSRLLESEGITYRFSHPSVKGDGPLPVEVVELVDATPSLEATASADPLPVLQRAAEMGENEAIARMSLRMATTTTSVFGRDHDWTRPDLGLDAYPSFDPPDGVERQEYLPLKATFSEYSDTAYGADDLIAQASMRLEGHLAGAYVLSGESNVIGMRAGLVFETDPNSRMSGSFFVVSVDHHSTAMAGAGSSDGYHNRFTCIPLAVPYRPPRIHRKPAIHGIQSALVVGEAPPDPKHRKIFVDKHGRIKVQFDWDRLGEKTERSSCYVRVSTAWAGNGYGVAFIPRVGMEVAVMFLEGDPDRPVVTGCLYNGENHFPLDDTQSTQSLIRTQSETGAGFNEMRFEDRDGQERIFVHAEKDYDEVVKNNHTTTVHNSQTESVDVDQSLTVGQDRTKTIKRHETITIEGNQKVHILGSQSFVIDGTAAPGGQPEGMDFDGGKVGITGDYKMETSKTVEVKAPDSITFIVGGTSIEILPDKITLQVDGGAKIVLDPNVLAQSAAGSKVVLDGNALSEASGGAKQLLDGNVLNQSSAGTQMVLDKNLLAKASTGAQIVLDQNALVDGAQTTVQGKMSTESVVGANSVKADQMGVTIMGTMVKIN